MTTQHSGEYLRVDQEGASPCIYISGSWTLKNYKLLLNEVFQIQSQIPDNTKYNLQSVNALDTAGASLLLRLIDPSKEENIQQLISQLSSEWQVLVETVATAIQGEQSHNKVTHASPIFEFFEQIGRTIITLKNDVASLLGFMGLVLAIMVRNLLKPARWRVTSLVANIEQIGLNAVPIIILLTFMVGAVIAFLGATVLASFGASVFTVDLVVFSFLREFAVLLTAILIAGRTASAFTAQLGLMKANEEIDAIQTLGLDPIELLVLPRVWALLISLPMLTFIGMISGIAGGMAVCALTLDISPAMFLSITSSDIQVRHFIVGMVKAPIFAFLIAIIGCLEGFKVSGSASSVGAHTTSSVVHSIFIVILVDAIAALYFMEMGW